MFGSGKPSLARVIPKAGRHAALFKGRDGLWPLVKSRKTFALPSGKLLSYDRDVRSMSESQLTRPLPGGGHL